MFSHLALALAGVCLTAAEWYFVPEILPGLLVYLALVWTSWKVGKRFVLPNWVANVLGLVIAAGAAGWVTWRVNDAAAWAVHIELPGALVPYLGPVLMALTLVRLFRPVRQDDFWLLQGLGLLQVALGCVLGSDTVFGVCLLAYLVAALCSVAAHHRESLVRRALPLGDADPPRWGRFALVWAAGVALLVWPLFLLAPRLESQEWRPSLRFALEPPGQVAVRTGFSDAINLNRASALVPDDAVVFTVVVTDPGRRPAGALPDGQRWRGIVLDRYEEGTWKSDLAWPGTGPSFRQGVLASGPTARHLEFEVPQSTGWLFLADPIALGEVPGEMPIWIKSRDPNRPPRLFFESGGTAVPLNYASEENARYVQSITLGPDNNRLTAVRVGDDYLRRILRYRVVGLEAWTTALMRRLAAKPDAPAGLAEAMNEPRGPLWSLPPKLWDPAARLLSDHLAKSGEYSYSLSNPRSGDEPDPVMDFLVNVREGSCERYASALTLMLRSLGIPARVVKGFRGAEYRGDGVHQIQQRHAHAWVEAALPAETRGQAYWLTLDPTPSLDAPANGWTQWLQQQQRSGQGLWQSLIIGYGSRQQESLWENLTNGRLLEQATPLLGLLLAGGVAFALLRFVPRGWGKKPRAKGPYGRLRELMARLGVTSQPGRTPQELADEAADRLRQSAATAALAGVPGAVVALLYRGRYGARPATPEELAAVGEQLRALEQALA